MKRLTGWIPVLILGASLLSVGACGEKKAEGDSAEEGAENSDASTEEAPDTEGEAKKDEADKDKAKTAKVVETPKGADGDKPEEASAANADAGTTEEAKIAADKLKQMGPEEEEAVTKRCGDAFDNTVNIMQTAGAPAKIVAQMRQQREKTVASCLEQAKIDPSGGQMIECMLAARLPADIRTCTRKFGNVKPLKPPVPGHGGH